MKKITWITVFLLLASPFFSRAHTARAADLTVTPASNLQEVFDHASPGDTVWFEDGIYYQSASINKALTLQAIHPGSVTLSGVYNGSFDYTPDPAAPGLYSAPVSWDVRWVVASNRILLNYQSLDHLVGFTFPTTGIPGPQEGFYYDPARQLLYLRLQGGVDPNRFQPQVNRVDHRTGLYINHSDVTVAGFRFHGWSEKAVYIETTNHNIHIQNNAFDSNSVGVGTVGFFPEHRAIYIENNEFSAFPVYSIRKLGGYELWQAMYDTNLNTAGIYAHANGMIIRHNYLYDLFDGIQVFGWRNLTAPTDIASDVSYNVIQDIVDNPLEFDSINEYIHLRAHHNFIFDSYTMVSMTSLQYGRLLVDHNIFYSSPEYGIPSTWFKTLINPGADPAKPVRNITLAHNTVVLSYDNDGVNNNQGSSLYTPNSQNAIYKNCKIQNNIVLVQAVSSAGRYELTKGDGFVFSPENILYGVDVPGDVLPDAIHANPGFAAVSPRFDFNLKPDGVAVGAGRNHDADYHHQSLDGATDLGAIEYGSQWEMPQPGPEWGNAAALPWRPPLPASLDPAFLGFDRSAFPTSKWTGNVLYFTTLLYDHTGR